MNTSARCCCCCCCCSHINSHNQVHGHRTGSSHSGAEEYPQREKAQTNQRWYTHIPLLTQFMSPPPPETYKSDIGSQSTMCQVHTTGAYVSLLAPGKTDCTACHPRKTTTYILHVVPITTHTHDRRRRIGKKETKKRKEDKGKKIRESEKRKRTENKEKTRKARKDKKTRRGSKGRKREKNVILADPRN